MDSETSVAIAEITNVSQAHDTEVQAELSKIIDKSLSEWPEEGEVAQLKQELHTESMGKLEIVYDEIKDMMPPVPTAAQPVEEEK